ncbi:hypothetical protein [Leucobacter japonicus]|uniref:hypothetical protein n=1 Tax=Leucobacter japonicus TaxID=1461259 RepID=UPI0006A7CA07|nr:hypothetical protein [Leucobacter japonicus]
MLRYIVERISDGVFLDLELPIVVSGAGRRLNGAGSFSGQIVPVVAAYEWAGTDKLIDPYATFIHEESDGVIRGTWLVTRAEFEGAVWRVDGAGFSDYFADRPYEGEYRGVQVDPVAVARHVVTHAQSFAGASIGVTLTGSSTVRVGTDSDEKVDDANEAAREAKRVKKLLTDARTVKTKEKQQVTKSHDVTIKGLQAVSKMRLTELQALRKRDPKPTPEEVTAAQNLRNAAVQAVKNAQSAKKVALAPIDSALVALREQIKTADATLKTASEKLKAEKEKQSDDGGAWKILWWDTPDCMQAIQEALDEVGYEWGEWSGWNADRSKILKEIRAVPRVGKKQTALAFVEGDNIVETVAIEADSNEYANVVKAIGAGEGKDSLEVTVAVKSARRRKVHVVDAKNVTKKSVLQKLAQAELAVRSRPLKVAAVRVVNHPNAEFGTFEVGDTILVDADSGWAGRQRLWQRIEELEWVGEDLIDLMLGDA